jgi:uncharacterized caspase-like protein
VLATGAARALRTATAALALAAGSSAAQAPSPTAPAVAAGPAAERRVAIVIGNAAYAGAPLRNPINDARAMAGQLRATGFEVIEARDATRAQILRAIERAREGLRGPGATAGRRGVGLLYYAGHGMQLDWRNYMLPVDANPRDATELAAQAVDVQEVIDAFRDAGTQINIVVLDACRDNPFGATAGSLKGLAPMDAPPGTLLAYATAPGNVAEDGEAATGAHGLYTRYLLQELGKPAVGIETLFKRVRHQVRRDSDGRQIPWESTSLEDEFFFAPAAAAASSGAAPAPAPAAEDDERDAREEAEAWQRARASGSWREVAEFLVRFPNGALAEQAQFRLDQLQRRKIQAQQRREEAGAASPAPGDWRYRVGDVLEYEVSGPAARSAGRNLPGAERVERADRADRAERATRPERPGRPERAARGDEAAGGGQGSRIRLEVTAADAERVEFNQGRVVTDQLGTSLVEAGVRKTPGHVKVPTELHVGKRWETAFDAHDLATGRLRARPRWSYRVAAHETVQVKAGRFKAWRIEGAGTDALVTPGRPRPRERILKHQLWVDAATLVVLKEELQLVQGGAALRDETRELLALKQAARR